ncbi:hypothetical protein KR50_14970 [Jeotgalibacillus campisalis]|uniref:Uncharacterized protein n=1 Tax=Jeotgalibacillus campisalis TaxID=220754 RepID=A0A0C2RAI8_9BACL|nr:hypothetical protein KR50_14970 [Jeotgalibacillus campisalis]
MTYKGNIGPAPLPFIYSTERLLGHRVLCLSELGERLSLLLYPVPAGKGSRS